MQGKRCMYWKRDSLHTFRSLEDKISGNAKMQWYSQKLYLTSMSYISRQSGIFSKSLKHSMTLVS